MGAPARGSAAAVPAGGRGPGVRRSPSRPRGGGRVLAAALQRAARAAGSPGTDARSRNWGQIVRACLRGRKHRSMGEKLLWDGAPPSGEMILSVPLLSRWVGCPPLSCPSSLHTQSSCTRPSVN